MTWFHYGWREWITGVSPALTRAEPHAGLGSGVQISAEWGVVSTGIPGLGQGIAADSATKPLCLFSCECLGCVWCCD